MFVWFTDDFFRRINHPTDTRFVSVKEKPRIDRKNQSPYLRIMPKIDQGILSKSTVNKSLYPIQTYQTEYGFVNQKTFNKVMCDVFVPHVEKTRKKVARE